MQRLTGLDAGFLSMETPTSPMHVGGLAIYDPSATEGWTIDSIKEVVRQRLHGAPPFRRRLVPVPFGLHHPVWIEDPEFDLDWHIRQVAVPEPGGPKELSELAAHLMALPLDRTRPLWEMWVIEGLEHGHLATLTKIHHAAIDGASGNEITVALFDLTPEVAEIPPPAEPWKPDRVPSDAELLGYAINSLARTPYRAARAARRTAETVLSLRASNRTAHQAPPPSPFSAPRTSINGVLTAERSYAMTSLSLSRAKWVKQAFETTVNDVVLAICAGALREYFAARDEHLDRPLVAMVPMSVRAEAEQGTMGNRVTSMLTSLATDIDDPVLRLLAIHEGMRGAKEQTNAIGADMLTDWAEFAAPAVFSRAVRLYSRTKLADRHRPLLNVTISNVPGPPFPLYSAGAKLVANYPLGPIFDGGGLNMTVMSYQDRLDFGLLACPDLVDDVWSIADGLRNALDDLVKAADEHTGARGPAEGADAPGAPAASSEVKPPDKAASRSRARSPKKAPPKKAPPKKAAPKKAARTTAASKKAPRKTATATAKKTTPKQPGRKRTTTTVAARPPKRA